jgi:hypothetical protein
VTNLISQTCCNCKCSFAIPSELYQSALAYREKLSFYCPYGHSQYFITGETEEAKLRRERNRLRQQIAEKDDTIREWIGRKETVERQLTATKGVVTRIKNRVGRGVCPCCNRTFENLQRHMRGKHPTYVAEAAE